MKAKTVMNPARLRILEYFILHGESTAAEIRGELADIPQASLYRHINALFDDGWIELVSEEKKRGATERRYRLKQNPPDDYAQNDRHYTDVLMSLLATFKTYFAKPGADAARDMLCISTSALLMSDEEYAGFLSAVSELVIKYMGYAPENGRKQRRITVISSPCEEEEQ